MAINMNDTSYRKLKVEDMDGQTFVEDETDESVSRTCPDERSILQMVQNQKWIDVLKELARTAPLASHNQQIKDKASKIAFKALTSFKVGDVIANVPKLSPEEVDTILHYVFRSFESVEDTSTCTTLLAFHDEIFKLTGHGGLLRVLYSNHRLHPIDA